MMTDYAKRLDELEDDLTCPDDMDVAEIDKATGELFSIARALLKETESPKASYDDLLTISDSIGAEKERDAKERNALRDGLKRLPTYDQHYNDDNGSWSDLVRETEGDWVRTQDIHSLLLGKSNRVDPERYEYED